MALLKQFSKSKPVCKVTFIISSEIANEAKQISLLGEFNDWNKEETPLKKQKDGTFKAILELEIDKDYQFKYLIDGDLWINDEAADKYVPAGIGAEENSVVSL